MTTSTTYQNLMDLFWCKFEHKNFEGITEETKNQIANDVILTLNESGLKGICSKYDYFREKYPRLSDYSDDSDNNFYSNISNNSSSYSEDEETETSSKNSKNEEIYSTSNDSISTKTATLSDSTTLDPEFITYTDLFNIFFAKTKQTAQTLLFGEW
jgi:hypothetical protein